MPLTEPERAFLEASRTATLATIAPDGRPRPVPVCFVLVGDTLYTPIDDKPKASTEPRELARVRDLQRRADVALLVEHWDEDWTHLGWLRVSGSARLEPSDPGVVAALREKYPQYADHDLEHRPLIAIVPERTVSWGDLSGRGTAQRPSGGGSGSSSSPGGSRRR